MYVFNTKAGAVQVIGKNVKPAEAAFYIRPANNLIKSGYLGSENRSVGLTESLS
jgi:hypothetical protein